MFGAHARFRQLTRACIATSRVPLPLCVFSMVFHFFDCLVAFCLCLICLYLPLFVLLFASLPNLFNPFHTFCWTQQTLWMLPKNCLGVHSARAKRWTNSLTHWQGPKVFWRCFVHRLVGLKIGWSENMVLPRF